MLVTSYSLVLARAAAAPAGRVRRRRRAMLLSAACALLGAAAAGAQQPAPSAGTPAAASPPPDSVAAPLPEPRARERSVGRRLDVHGYLAQGAALSRGGQVYGIPNDGTVDLRRAAVLGSYRLGQDDRVVAQLAHRRVGEAPRARMLPEVKLDWLFWEHGFGDATRLRVGRFPIPYGIFAETRYVGTLLPFFQAPASFYRESEFTNEALDGASLGHELFATSAFPLELTAYVGGLDYVESLSLPLGPQGAWRYVTAPAAARRVAGVQAWLGTPVPGLRVGGGFAQGQIRGGVRPAGQRDTLHGWYASVDGSFERFTARAELIGFDMQQYRARAGYVQLGVRPARRLWLNAQAERTLGTLRGLPLPPTYAPGSIRLDHLRDLGASAVWSVPGVRSMQLRAEAHRSRGYHVEADDIAATAPARRGRQFLVGVATAF